MAPGGVASCTYCWLEMRYQNGLLVDDTGPVLYSCTRSPDGRHRLGSIPLDPAIREHEMKLRAHRCRLAEQHAGIPYRFGGPGQWSWGTCARCHADDLVKGPASQPLCTYCDQLRVMPPPPARVRPADPASQRHSVRLSLSVLTGLAGLIMALCGMSPDAVAPFLLLSFILTAGL